MTDKLVFEGSLPVVSVASTIPITLLAKISKTAKDNNTSRSKVVRKILEAYYDDSTV